MVSFQSLMIGDDTFFLSIRLLEYYVECVMARMVPWRLGLKKEMQHRSAHSFLLVLISLVCTASGGF
eukprot:21420-Eustigmatos_ZCMA.PRE.1